MKKQVKRQKKLRLTKAVSNSTESSKIRLVAGLGNPGRKYLETRHNVGFMLLDRLATSQGESWAEEKKWHTQVFRSGDAYYLKPQTFMNESGKAVAAVSKFYQLTPDQLLVVYDDVDLPLGSLRFRADGSAGGHNGIKSIISHLGTQAFPRLKVGIGRSEGAKKMIGHVLGKFETEEQEILEKTLQEAQSALECALDRGLDTAMNQFNRKPKSKKKQPKPNPENKAEEPTSAEEASSEPNCDE